MESIEFFKPIDESLNLFIDLVGISFDSFRRYLIMIISGLTAIQIAVHLVRFGLHGKSDESPIGFLLKLTFWYTVIFYTPEIMRAVQRTFVQLGAIASNSGIVASPSAIIRAGWKASFSLLQLSTSVVEDMGSGRFGGLPDFVSKASVLIANVPKIILALVIGAVIMLCYILIMAQFFLAYVEFAILGAAAVVLLPLGLLKYTSFVNEKVVGAIISHGVKLMLLQLVIGIGIKIFAADNLTGGATDVRDLQYGHLVSAAVSSVLFAIICMNIPALATGIMSGQPTLASGQATQQTAAAGAAMAHGAKNMGRMAGALVKGAATGGIGAVGAATKALGAGKSAGQFFKGVGGGAAPKAALRAVGRSLAGSAGNTLKQAGSNAWKRLNAPSAQRGRAGLQQIAQNRRTQSSGLVDYMKRSASEGNRVGESSAIRMGQRMERQLGKKELRRNAPRRNANNRK